jgi:serine/threonine protein kinase
MTEETIFATVLGKPTPAERSAYLDEVCAGNAALRQRVEGLLRAHEEAGNFLERPAVEQIAAAVSRPNNSTEAIGLPLRTVKADAPAAIGDCLTETQAERPDGDAAGVSLDFLEPTQKPNSLGRLGHYEVLEVIGSGGMGIVLRALDETLHRVVAIKVMAPELAANATARKRFMREAQAAAAVSHDQVVTIHAVEEAKGLPYIVMQFVAGVSLQERLERTGPLGLKEIVRIGTQTAEGLAAAHKQGLVHRDVKPANILLENSVERVKLSDFGLARAAADASLTQSGVVAGTPMFMAPEQARGEPVDHRADLFSLGSVLYALCTGRPPFRAGTAVAVLKRVCEDTPRAICETNPEIPGWLCDIIAKLHAKDPNDRFQSANEVADLLGQYLAHLQLPARAPMPVATPPKPAPTASPRQPRFRWVAVLLIGIGVPVLIAPLAYVAEGWFSHGGAFYVGFSVLMIMLAVFLAATTRRVLDRSPAAPASASPALAHFERWVIYWPGLFLLIAGVWYWLGADILRFVTNTGVLVFDASADGVGVVDKKIGIVRVGHPEDSIRILDTRTRQSLDLPAGHYQLQVLQPEVKGLVVRTWLSRDDGFPTEPISHAQLMGVLDLSPSKVSVSRGSRQVVRFVLRRPPPQAPAARPFVILARDGRAERPCFNPVEAVAFAKSGDVIEVRGDGPFVTDPLLIDERLTIRAADGFRPVFRLSPEATDNAKPLIENKAPLVLEGLELQVVNARSWVSETPTERILLTSGAPLYAANCRFIVTRKGSEQHALTCVQLLDCPACELRNCLLLQKEEGAVLLGVASAPPKARMGVENCLTKGGVGIAVAYDAADPREARLVLKRNTIISSLPLVLYLKHRRPDLAGKDDGRRDYRIDSSENVLTAGFQVNQLPSAGDALSAEELEAVARRLVGYHEERDLHSLPSGAEYLVVARNHQPIHASRRRPDLPDWEQFWPLGDTKSLQGQVHFRRNNKAAEPESLTPDDFRLRRDSPGKGAGAGGDDLGADVDLVGPGPAYKRWKKTPHYQQWLKETGQVRAGR